MPALSNAYVQFIEAPNGEPLKVAEAIRVFNAPFVDLTVKVEGEVANLSLNKGQFVFFDLKDEQEEARLRCFMMAFRLTTPLENGMRVVIEAKPQIHSKSGVFSLVVSRFELKGEGSIKRAFELLKAKLEKEGLFAPERKRSLSAYVQRVGIISSSQAAGFLDFKRIAFQRLPGVEYILCDVSVQGRSAEEEIGRAFDYLNERYLLDAIVLIRGGGSLEDLHAFNSESVARAIVRSKAPVLVGVGHEQDVTIADLCADVRAATPSNAAQILLPEIRSVLLTLDQLVGRGQLHLERIMQWQNDQCDGYLTTIRQGIVHSLQRYQERVVHLEQIIISLSPQMTLKRGYTITCNQSGGWLSSARQLKTKERLLTHFQDGEVSSVII